MVAWHQVSNLNAEAGPASKLLTWNEAAFTEADEGTSDIKGSPICHPGLGPGFYCRALARLSFFKATQPGAIEP